jgi:hypothetical protein
VGSENYNGTTGNLIAWVKIPCVEYVRHAILSVLWGPIDRD